MRVTCLVFCVRCATCFVTILHVFNWRVGAFEQASARERHDVCTMKTACRRESERARERESERAREQESERATEREIERARERESERAGER